MLLGYPILPLPSTGMGALGLSYAIIQEVVETGVVVTLPSPSPAVPAERVATLLLLHVRFMCGVARDRDLPPVWEAVATEKIRTEELENLNQTLMRGVPSCHRVFGGRAQYSASLHLLAFLENVSLWNPYIYQSCARGGVSLHG